MIRDQFIKWFTTLDQKERSEILSEIRSIDNQKFKDEQPLRDSKAAKNREKYKKDKIEKEKRGKNFSKIITPGDIVKCEGTRDTGGYRLVLDTHSWGFTGQRLLYKKSKSLEFPKPVFGRDAVITSHFWNKVTKIIENTNIKES